MADSKQNPSEVTESEIPKAAELVVKRHNSSTLKKLAWVSLVSLIVIVLGWMGVYVYFGYTNQFPIQTVKVIGVYQYVNQQDIQTTLEPYIRGKGLFAFSEWQAEEALAELPGVASVTIWRVPPAKIKVIIRERSAIARFEDGELLGDDGVPFYTTNPAGASNLPLLNGNPLYAKQMLEMIESLKPVFATINASVTGLGLAPNGDWSVQINNQTWITLGKTDLQDRVLNFLTAYPALMQTPTATGGGTLNTVDLRYEHGFTASWLNVPAPAKKTSKTSAKVTTASS